MLDLIAKTENSILTSLNSKPIGISLMICYIMAILGDIRRFSNVIDRLYLVMINTLIEGYLHLYYGLHIA